MNLCAKRGPGGSGRTDTSFLLVAGEYLWHGGDEREKGKGKYPLVSKGKDLTTKRGAELGTQDWVLKEVYRQKRQPGSTHIILHGCPHAY